MISRGGHLSVVAVVVLVVLASVFPGVAVASAHAGGGTGTDHVSTASEPPQKLSPLAGTRLGLAAAVDDLTDVATTRDWFGALLPGDGVAAVEPLDGCTLIDSPGRYELQGDIVDSTDDVCIDVLSDDVILDGNGHTIDGVSDDSTFRTGVFVAEVSNVTVTDVDVSGWNLGIEVFDATDVTLRDVEARDNDEGIVVVEAAATVENVRAVDNADFGLVVEDATATVTITDTLATGNPFGIDVFASTVEFERVTATENTDGGIGLFDGSTGTLTDAVVADNDVDLELNDSTATATNLSVGSATLSFDARDVLVSGVDSPPADPTGRENVGVHFDAKSTSPAGFLDVTVSYADADLSGVDESTLALSEFDGATWTEVPGSSRNEAANTVSANLTEFSVFAPLGESSDGGGPGGVTEVAGCRVIDSPGRYELTGDITDSTASVCIDIRSSDVTFDGNGYAIDGVDGFETTGVRVDGAGVPLSNVTVRNLTVSEWSDGIRYENTSRGSVEGATALDNDFSGVRFVGSPNGTLVGVSATDNGFLGVVFADSPNGTLTEVATARGMTGVLVDGSHDTTLTNVSVVDGAEEGLTVLGSDDVTLTNVLAINNSLGALVRSSVDVVVDGGTFAASRGDSVRSLGGHGLRVETSPNATVRGAIADDNAGDGVFVTGQSRGESRLIADGSNGTLVTDVTARNNVRYGLSVDSASDVRFVGIVAEDNAVGGVFENATDVRIAESRFAEGTVGLAIAESENVTVDDSEVVNNTVVDDTATLPVDLSDGTGGEELIGTIGVLFVNTTDASLTDTEVSDSFLGVLSVYGDGIEVVDSEVTDGLIGVVGVEGRNVTLTGNEIRNNTREVPAGVSIDFSAPSVEGFGLAFPSATRDTGIFLQSVDGVDVADNTVSDSTVGVAVFEPTGSDPAAGPGDTDRIRDNDVSNAVLGIVLSGIDDANVTGNTITEGGGIVGSLAIPGFGLVVLDGSGNELADNTVRDQLVGVGLANASDNTLVRTTVTNASFGVVLDGADGNELSDTDATGNVLPVPTYLSAPFPPTGVAVSESDDTVLSNTTASANVEGVVVFAASGTDVRNLTARNNTANGLVLDGSSATLADVTAVDNGRWAVFAENGSTVEATGVDVGSAVLDAAVRDVALAGVDSPPADPSGRANVGVYLNATNTSGSGYLNATVDYDQTAVDAAGIEESSLQLWRNDGTGWEPVPVPVPGSSVDVDANTVSANVTAFSVFAPLGAVTGPGGGTDVSACRVIDSPGRYELTGDITDSTASTCITIRSSDVIFDGNGHTIDGVGRTGGSRRAVEFDGRAGRLSNVTVRNLTVTEWRTGINVLNATDGAVERIRATNNTVGVDVAVSDTISVRDVTAVNSTTGILLDSAFFVTVRDVSVVKSVENIELVASGGNTFENVTSRTAVEAFLLNDGPLGRTAGRNTFRNISIEDVQTGFELSDRVGGHTFVDVSIVDVEAGFFVPNNVPDNTFRNVSVRSPLAAGILLGSNNNTVQNVSVEDVRGERFTTGETFTTAGIYVLGTSNNTLADVSVRNSSGDGLAFDRSSDVSLTNATVTNSARHGLFVNDTREARVTDVELTTSGVWDYFAGNGTRNVTVERLTTTAGTLSFESGDVALSPTTQPSPPPSGVIPLGTYVDATNTTLDSSFGVSYDDADVATAGLDESTLTLWRWNGSVWSEVSGSTVNTTTNVVSGNVTGPGVYTAFGQSAVAGGGTDVSACRVIDSPGRYDLVGDILDSTANVCIDIRSSDVIFDGGGHTIDGVNATGTVGVYANGTAADITNVTLRNVDISEWGDAVRYENATAGTVETVRAEDNRDGFEFVSSPGVTVTGVSVNASDDGFRFDDSGDNRFTHVSVVDSDDEGFSFDGSGNNRFTHVSVVDSEGDGLSFFESANNTLIDVSVVDSESSGIYFAFDRGNNSLVNVSVVDSESSGIEFSGGFGFDGGNNSLVNVSVVDSSGGAVEFFDGGSNTLTDVSAVNSTGFEFFGDGNNILTNVSATNSTGDGFEFFGDGNNTLTDVSATNSTWEGFEFSEGDNRLTNVSVVNSSLAGFEFFGDGNNTLTNVSATDSTNYGFLFFGGNNTLTNVSATGVRGSGVGFGDGSGFVIVGINDTLTNVTATDNAGAGVWILSSNETTLTDVSAVNNSVGVEVLSSDRAELVGGLVERNRGDGILLETATNTTINGSLFLDNRRDGVLVTNESNGTLVTGVTAIGNDRYGLYVTSSSDVTFADNLAANNGDSGLGVGIAPPSTTGTSRDLTFENNDALDNDEHGIELDDSAVSVTLVGNNASDNAFDGVHVDGSEGVTVRQTIAARNGRWAVFVANVPAPYTVDELTTDGAELSYVGRNVAVADAAAPGTAPPSGQTALGVYVNATPTGTPAFFDAVVSYDQTAVDAADVEESTIRLWEFDDATGTWEPVDSSVDADADTVSANVTDFSTFAPLGEPEGVAEPNLVVDDDGLQCSVASHATIGSAVDAAGSGDTIEVCSGTYPESVTLDANVSVVANGTAVLDGTGTNATAFEVVAAGVTIDGFEIRDYTAQSVRVAGVDRVAVVNTRVEYGGASATGVDPATGVSFVEGANDGTVENSVFVGGENADLAVEVAAGSTGGSANATVRDNEITVDAGRGIGLLFAPGSAVVANNVTLGGTTDAAAIAVRLSDGATVERNELNLAIGSGQRGIDISDSGGHVVAANAVTGGEIGVGIGGGASGPVTVVRENTFANQTGGVGAAVSVAGATGDDDLIRSNVVTDSDTGVRIAGSDNVSVADTRLTRVDEGVVIDGATGTTVRGALITTADVGIDLAGGVDTRLVDAVVANATTAVAVRSASTNTTVTNLTLDSAVLSFDARDVAIAAVGTPPTDPADRRNVSVFLDATAFGSDPFLNLSVAYDDADLTAAGVEESTLGLWRFDDATGTWEPVDSSTDVDANTVSANVTEFSTFAPLGAVTGPGAGTDVSACRVVDSPGVYRLTTDILDSTASVCLDVRSSDVILDGKGHTVDGVDAADTAGVFANGTAARVENVTVRNLTVSDWGDGIRFENTTDGRVVDTVAERNGDGFELIRSPGVAFVDVSVENSNATGLRSTDSAGGSFRNVSVARSEANGFAFEASGNNVFTDVSVNDSEVRGFEFSNAGGNRFTDVSVADSRDNGFEFGDSGDNTFTDVTVRNSSRNGFRFLIDAGNNRFRNVTVVNSSSIGFNFFLISGGNTFTNVSAVESGSDGFMFAFRATGDNTFTDVSVETAGGHGFSFNAGNNTFTDVTVRNGRSGGFELYDAGENSLTNVSVVDSGPVGYRVAVADNTLVNVSAINSSAEGFLFTGADGTILTDLSASDNAVGLSIVGSVGVVVDGGDFDRNDRTGVRVGSAPGTTIGGAVVSDNVRDGIEVDGSDGVTIRDTIARDNGRWAVIASNGAGAYTAENLTLRSAVLDARARDVALAGVESPPADPADRRNVGVYVNATNTATGGYLDLNASYDPTVVDGVDVNESTLGLWEHDGSTWEPVDSSVDTDANTVSANLTEFSTFAPLGVVETVSEPEPTPTPTSTPTPTPVVGDRGSGSGGPNVPPVAAFTVPTTDPETGTAVGFDASGSDDSTGIVVSYEWDFDGDGTTDATSSSPGVSHTYDVAGTYEVSLTVVDSFGATNTTIRTVEVSQASGSGSGVGSGGVEATPTATTPTPTPTTETPASPPEADADADGETATATAAVTPVPPAALFGVQFPWWLLLVLLAAVVAVLVYRRRA